MASNRPHAPGRATGAGGSPKEDAIERKVIFSGVGITAIALAYFFAADHYYFSTRYMTQIFRLLLLEYDGKTAWLSLGVCAVAACWTSPVLPLKVVDFIGAHINAFLIFVVTLLTLATLLVYQNNAFSMDEYSEVFQAKVFAAGHLAASVPPSVVDWLVPRGFNGGFLLSSESTGETIEVFWPGFSMVLALFEVVHAPWLCNPCLSGLTLFLVHRITREITGDTRSAAWAVLFTVASGAFVAYGISCYSMQARLAGNLLFAWLLMKPGPYRCFGAGVAGSFALIVHSPFPHVLFAAPWIISLARSNERRRLLLQLTLGYLPLLLVVGAGWLQLRAHVSAGHASALDPIAYNAGNVFSLPDKSMFDMRVAAVVKMVIWAAPCMFVFAVLGRIRFASDYRVRLLMQSALVTFVGYIFVIFDQGHGWGYRYLHPAWGVVPILAACAMLERRGSIGRLAAFAGAAAILNLILVIPYQMAQVHGIIAAHSAQLPEPRRPGRNVYFIGDGGGFYPADLVQFDPTLRSPDLILYSRGPELDAQLRQQNWPQAVLVARKGGVDEWNLPPTGARGASGDSGDHPWANMLYARTAPAKAAVR